MAKFLYSVLPPYTREICDIIFDVNYSGERIKTLEGYLDSIDELVYDSLRDYIVSILTFTDIDKIRDDMLPYLGFLLGYEWNNRLTIKYQRELLKNIVSFYKRKGTPYSLYYQLYAYDSGVLIYEPFRDIWILNKSILSGSNKNSETKQKHYLPSINYYSRGIFVVKTTTDPKIIREVIETVRPAGTKALIEYSTSGLINMNPFCFKEYENSGKLPSNFNNLYFPFGIEKIGKIFNKKTNISHTQFGFYSDPSFSFLSLLIGGHVPEDIYSYIVGEQMGALSGIKKLFNGLHYYLSNSVFTGTSILPTSKFNLTDLYSFSFNKSFESSDYHFNLSGKPLQWKEEIGIGNGTNLTFGGIISNKITSVNESYLEFTDGNEIFIDDGLGNIINNFGTIVGNINYTTKIFNITFSSAPIAATKIYCSLKYLDENYEYISPFKPNMVRVNGLLLKYNDSEILEENQWNFKYNELLGFNTIYVTVPHTMNIDNTHLKVREKLLILQNRNNSWVTDDVIPSEKYPIKYITYYYTKNINSIYLNKDLSNNKNKLNTNNSKLETTNRYNNMSIFRNDLHKDKGKIGTNYGFITNNNISKLGHRNWLEFDKTKPEFFNRTTGSAYVGKNAFMSSGIHYEEIGKYTVEQLTPLMNCKVSYPYKYSEIIENTYKDINYTSSFQISELLKTLPHYQLKKYLVNFNPLANKKYERKHDSLDKYPIVYSNDLIYNEKQDNISEFGFYSNPIKTSVTKLIENIFYKDEIGSSKDVIHIYFGSHLYAGNTILPDNIELLNSLYSTGYNEEFDVLINNFILSDEDSMLNSLYSTINSINKYHYTSLSKYNKQRNKIRKGSSYGFKTNVSQVKLGNVNWLEC